MRHRITKTLPYTPEQLFQLVGDVEAYPSFIPWVLSVRTFNPSSGPDGVTGFDAEARVGFAFLRESFSTRVRRDPAALQIDADLISGPFLRLRNRWRFLQDPLGSRIEFDIDFAFKSRLLEGLLHRNFDSAVGRLMAAFEDRARVLYGVR